jgi:ADP-ribose pyrophosphatase
MKSNNPTLNNLKENTLEEKEIYKGRSFSFYSDTVSLPNGKKAKKDYVKYPHAAAVIPFLDEKHIILVEQFRYPIGRTLLEIPAGKLDDPEESKLEAAHRELLEETGYRAKSFNHLITYYPCPGYSTEVLHIFKAENLKKEEQFLDEDEFINVKTFTYSEILKMIKNGEIQDSKTIIAMLYYQSIKGA